VESIGDGNISSPAHIGGDGKQLMSQSQESEKSCELINGGSPQSCAGLLGKVLRLASFPDWQSFPGPFSRLYISNPSVQLAARHRTLPVIICEALMNFNPRAAFVGEKLDHTTLVNHANNELLVGLIG
jgi:hypothetical protein